MEGGAKRNSSTLSTSLDLGRFDCANKQPKKTHCHFSLYHGCCLCHYLSKYLEQWSSTFFTQLPLFRKRVSKLPPQSIVEPRKGLHVLRFTIFSTENRRRAKKKKVCMRPAVCPALAFMKFFIKFRYLQYTTKSF